MNEIPNQILNFEETTKGNSTFPYIIFHVGSGIYGISTKHIISIEEYKEVTHISNKPYGVRGISYYKEEAINLFDLRTLFGIPSIKEEIENVIDLEQRIRDHENYVTTLEECIKNNTVFTLTTDPHKCKLGKWIDSYTPPNENLQLTIDKVIVPHTKLHESAGMIIQMQKSGHHKNVDEALNTIKNVYKKEVISYLELLNKQLYEKVDETVIVLKVENKKCGIIVDSVETVEYIQNIQSLPGNLKVSQYIKDLGFRSKSGAILLVLECSAFK